VRSLPNLRDRGLRFDLISPISFLFVAFFGDFLPHFFPYMTNQATPRQIAMSIVSCPVCAKEIPIHSINKHLDSGCTEAIPPATAVVAATNPSSTAPPPEANHQKKLASIFSTPSKRQAPSAPPVSPTPAAKQTAPPTAGPQKRQFTHDSKPTPSSTDESTIPPTKRQKTTAVLRDAMPLAEKMRPQSLDEVCGQDLVGKGGVLRGLIEEGRVPSMILWGTAGCGKTTIARVIANVSASRFVEISATASGVQECKKIFAEAKSELLFTGRKTILFCDEIHRFTKSQQDVFLAPVEKGEITL